MPASTYNRRVEGSVAFPSTDGTPRPANAGPPDLWPSPHPRAGITDPTVTIDGRPHDAAAEHHSPEESTALLHAELDACRAEILRLRATGDALAVCIRDVLADVAASSWSGALASWRSFRQLKATLDRWRAL